MRPFIFLFRIPDILFSDHLSEECGFNYDKIVLSLARGLQGSARSSQDTVDFDERG